MTYQLHRCALDKKGPRLCGGGPVVHEVNSGVDALERDVVVER